MKASWGAWGVLGGGGGELTRQLQRQHVICEVYIERGGIYKVYLYMAKVSLQCALTWGGSLRWALGAAGVYKRHARVPG